MTELNGNFSIGLRVDEINDAFPSLLMLVTIEAGAARRDSPLGRHASHLGKNQPGSALRTFSVMHEMPVGRITFYRTILRHRRNHDTVFELNAAHAEWHEHRRMIDLRCQSRGLFFEPFFSFGQPRTVALTQIFMTNALRARAQRIIKLN